MRGEWLLVVGEIDLDATPWLVNQPRAYSGVVVRCWRCRLVCCVLLVSALGGCLVVLAHA
jgi:hypothetical protein